MADEEQGGDRKDVARRLAGDEPYARIVAHVEGSDESLRLGNAALVAAVMHRSGTPMSALDIGRHIIGKQDDKVVRNFTYPALKRLTTAGVVRIVPGTFTYVLTDGFRGEIDRAGVLTPDEAARVGDGIAAEVGRARAEPADPDAVDFHGLDLPRGSLEEAEGIRRDATDMAERGDTGASDAFREALEPPDWRRLVHETAFAGVTTGDGRDAGPPATGDATVPDMTAGDGGDGDGKDEGMKATAGNGTMDTGTMDTGMTDTATLELVEVPATRVRGQAASADAPLKGPERDEVQAVVASVTASLQALRDRKAGESRARVHAEVVRRLDAEIRAMLAEGIPLGEIREAVSAGGFDLPESYGQAG